MEATELAVMRAIGAAARALYPDVPAGRVYVRSSAIFEPARDLLPSLLVVRTLGAGFSDLKKLRHTDRTFSTTVILLDNQNRNVAPNEPAAPEPDRRSLWAEALASVVCGKPLTAVTGCLRVFLAQGPTLDMTQFESSNLFWQALNLRTVVRIPRT